VDSPPVGCSTRLNRLANLPAKFFEEFFDHASDASDFVYIVGLNSGRTGIRNKD
jgi:hypothetical protein